jgi:hypothetical protein
VGSAGAAYLHEAPALTGLSTLEALTMELVAQHFLVRGGNLAGQPGQSPY